MTIQLPSTFIPSASQVSGINAAVSAISENIEFFLFRRECWLQTDGASQQQVDRATHLAKKMLRA